MFLNCLPRKVLGGFVESQVGDRGLSHFKLGLINSSLRMALVCLCGLSLLRKILRRPGLVLLIGFIAVMLLGGINPWLGLIAACIYFAGSMFLIYLGR